MQQPRVLTVFGLTFWVLLESLRRVHPRIRQCLHVPARWCEIETLATPHTGMARRFCGWGTPGGTVSGIGGGVGGERDPRHPARGDGTPFLWLGDTWWHGLGDRVTDGEFSELARHRAAQGFNAVQIVAGLNVDVEVFSPLGASLAGWPWTEGFGDINHAWWQGADKRILALVKAGLVPVIFGAWGYYLTWMSDEHMMAHWREIIARWSALPVVWCVAGEVTLPYYPNPMREVTSAE